jgi:ectoine hydroxylase-related dioxygenase (phytanoyl-CoA dioxygenase family)
MRLAWDRDGYVLLDGFLTPTEVAGIEAEIAAFARKHAGETRDSQHINLEKQGDASLDHNAAAKRPGMLRKVAGAVFVLPSVRQVFCAGRLPRLVAELGGKDAVYYHSSKVMFKPARGGAAKPWHQDAAYWRQYAARQITVWIAIHDADRENGCVWAIPGSHHLGLIPHVQHELQVPESSIDLAKAVPVPVKAGGVLIFHSLVLHMSHKNHSDRDRWAIICDYDCAANPCLDRGEDGLAAGVDAAGVWRLG